MENISAIFLLLKNFIWPISSFTYLSANPTIQINILQERATITLTIQIVLHFLN